MSNLFRGLEHIGIKVQDMEKSIKFYTEVLGFEFINRMKPGDVELVFVKLGNTVIELIESDGSVYGDGVVNHIALNVTDILAAVEHLKRQKIEMISQEPKSIGPGKYNFFFRGPSGEKLELFQG